MNDALSRLADEVGLQHDANTRLRLAFGLACVNRVQHLLEDPEAVECVKVLRAWVEGKCGDDALGRAAQGAARIANGHRGSNSIDGAAHAAVSATYAVAKALDGRALEAASYAAYASVYAYGGYAVTDPASFEPEFAWQRETLRQLARDSAALRQG